MLLGFDCRSTTLSGQVQSGKSRVLHQFAFAVLEALLDPCFESRNCASGIDLEGTGNCTEIILLLVGQ